MTTVANCLIVLGCIVCLLNWAYLIVSICSRRWVNAVPLIGALTLGCGLALLPQTRSYVWIALIADYGTLVFIFALPQIAYEAWSTSKFNLLHAYRTSGLNRTVLVKLYRRNIAVISTTFQSPVDCNDHGARIVSFGLVGKWSPTPDGFAIDGYASDRRLLLSREGDAYTTVELNYPEDSKYPYDSLHALVVRKVDS